jgi:hypothetical protein
MIVVVVSRVWMKKLNYWITSKDVPYGGELLVSFEGKDSIEPDVLMKSIRVHLKAI